MSVNFRSQAQIQSQSELAYLNIDEQDNGRVSVWGNCHNQPTVLVRSGDYFELIAFDSEEAYREWFSTHPVLQQETTLRLDKPK